MNRFVKTALVAGLLIAGVGIALLVVFLVGQGLVRASLWGTIGSSGLAAIGTAASVWGLITARRTPRIADDSATMDSRRSGGPTGAITQVNSGGVNIAHTGEGDINVSGSAQ
jgi:hypothetical protein